MSKYDRRKFLQTSGLGLAYASMNLPFGLRGYAATLSRTAESLGLGPNAAQAVKSGIFYNTNLQTAIGLGDALAGIVDRYGQLDSRNARVGLDFGSDKPESAGLSFSQSLAEGYYPVVSTEAKSAAGTVRSTAFASDAGGDCFEIGASGLPVRVQLWFPYATSIRVKDGVVTSRGSVLAIIPKEAAFKTTEAKYNFLTPVRDAFTIGAPPWSPVMQSAHCQPVDAGLDAAFDNGRSSFLLRPLRYRLPVQAGKTYHVVLGLVIPKKQCDIGGVDLPKTSLELSVNRSSLYFDLWNLVPGQPYLHEFVVQPSEDEILVKVETDPSSPDPYRSALLNVIWVFDHPVDPNSVKTGALNKDALFYVPCGQEPPEDIAASLTIDLGRQYTLDNPARILLPYDLREQDLDQHESMIIHSTIADGERPWKSLLARGAEFVTGDEKLDNLYKTSLINLFLLRAKYPGVLPGGEDLYIVKPGATIYNAFWYRDGAYITTAFDVAGLSDEAEKSVRLFWKSGLPKDFVPYGQMDNGSWQAPLNELDGQGQALWALCQHFEFSGDVQWLKQVYPSLRKGLVWIKEATDTTKVRTEHGEKPIYYGLLPSAEGEAIGFGYNYYHDYWAILGLRKVIEVAKVLEEEQDVKWMQELYETFNADLLASIKQAYQNVGESKYIPATPYDPVTKLDYWGTIAALYPTRFLDPHDTMLSQTLDRMEKNSQEGEYTYDHRQKLWTYITADWAMCYLLRDDIETFHRLYDGYVAHASPTNAWIEEMFIETRLGTGDMPHGWAAAQYVHLHRNALVYEDEGILHLCWGARQEWFEKGISVKHAPTKFGAVELTLKASGDELSVNYLLTHGAQAEALKEVRLHIHHPHPSQLRIRVNGKAVSVESGKTEIRLE